MLYECRVPIDLFPLAFLVGLFFLDLVAVPMLHRALFEVNLRTLDAEVDAHVARSVAFFLADCPHGGVS